MGTLLDRFRYDEGSFSCLRWVDGPNKDEDAGCKVYRKNGKPKTIKVSVDSKGYRCHRIIWEMFNGPIPEGLVVDHIDRNPFNNKISNLELKTIAENNRNRSKASTSKTGVAGVYSYKTGNEKRYVARWSLEGKEYEKHFSVGLRSEEEALEQACKYRKKMMDLLNSSGVTYSETHGM
jgi:hypothetical protein